MATRKQTGSLYVGSGRENKTKYSDVTDMSENKKSTAMGALGNAFTANYGFLFAS